MTEDSEQLSAQDTKNDLSDQFRSIPAPGRLKTTITDRRARIVQACIEELREHGFPIMKVESVARRAGLDKRTLYDYIQRKEDLLLLVFGHYLPRILTRVRDARDRTKSPSDQLRLMLQSHAQIVSENPHFVLFFYRELRYLIKDDQVSVLSMINDIHEEYRATFEELLEGDGELTTPDAELCASSALSMIDMIGLYGPHVPQRDPEVIANHILGALVKSPDQLQ